MTSLVTIYCSIYFISDTSADLEFLDSNSSMSLVKLNDGAKLTFLALIVVSNIGFFVFWIFKMYQDIRAKFRKMLPKIYVAVCLCFDKKRLKKELHQ